MRRPPFRALAFAAVLAPAAPRALPAQEDAAVVPVCRALPAGEGSVEPCRAAARQRPTDLALRLRLADALAAAGRDREALDAYATAIRLAPDSADAWFAAARLHDRRGDRKAALRHYQAYARLATADAAGPEIVGWLELETGHADRALAAFREGIRRDSTSGGSSYGAGLALQQLGRHAEAIRQLQLAVRLAPGKAEAWGGLARSALALRREQEAAGYWERALSVDGGYFDSRRGERRRWERLVRRVGQQAAPALPAMSVTPAVMERPLAAIESLPAAPRVPGTLPRVRPAPVFVGGGSTGSGVVVTQGGDILTNRHVVRSCAEVRVRPDGGAARAARVVALDADDDLALLRTDNVFATAASFRGGREPRVGEDVVAIGYPLNGLLADQAHATTGAINALAGMYNDQHELEMSAPVQPGNSGGPLLDANGQLVGIVVTKLNAKVVAEAMGDLPQNVNFAIKGAIAREFLAGHGIAVATGFPGTPLSNADVAEIGRQVTVLVECVRPAR